MLRWYLLLILMVSWATLSEIPRPLKLVMLPAMFLLTMKPMPFWWVLPPL